MMMVSGTNNHIQFVYNTNFVPKSIASEPLTNEEQAIRVWLLV